MAWRKQPYYDQLHPWARNNFDKEIYVLVFVNDEATLIPSRKGRTSVRKDNGPGFATYRWRSRPASRSAASAGNFRLLFPGARSRRSDRLDEPKMRRENRCLGNLKKAGFCPYRRCAGGSILAWSGPI